MGDKAFYVYMVTNKPNGTIYKGMTSNLVQRIYQHREGVVEGFTSKYGLKRLVWYKECGNAENAVKWEKKLRKYPRQWKINLIEEINPNWKDLYNDICK